MTEPEPGKGSLVGPDAGDLAEHGGSGDRRPPPQIETGHVRPGAGVASKLGDHANGDHAKEGNARSDADCLAPNGSHLLLRLHTDQRLGLLLEVACVTRIEARRRHGQELR